MFSVDSIAGRNCYSVVGIFVVLTRNFIHTKWYSTFWDCRFTIRNSTRCCDTVCLMLTHRCADRCFGRSIALTIGQNGRCPGHYSRLTAVLGRQPFGLPTFFQVHRFIYILSKRGPAVKNCPGTRIVLISFYTWPCVPNDAWAAKLVYLCKECKLNEYISIYPFCSLIVQISNVLYILLV